MYIYIYIYRSDGFALTGYDIPGCVEDGSWTLCENSSVAVAVVAHLGLGGWARNRLFPKSNHKNAAAGAFL